MKATQINRRHFLHASLLTSTLALAGSAGAAIVKPKLAPDDGLKLGMASYTYNKFSLDEAIRMTREAGLKYINLKDVHLPYKSTKEERQAARAKVEAAGLKLMGGGVIYIKNDEQDVKDKFDYCVDAGMPVMVCSPEPEILDAMEKMAKQTGVLVAIHNHGPTDKKYPSPLDVLAMIKDRDPIMGICMDIGHTARVGVDPVECVEKCGDRLHDMHFKDVNSATPKGSAVVVGRGVLDIVGVFKALKERNYPYHIGLEYEANSANPQPGVLESIGYARGVLAAIG